MIPNAQPLQSVPEQPGQAPIVPGTGVQPTANVVQAASLANDTSTTIPASHVEPILPPVAEQNMQTGIRMPIPRRTVPNQGTLLPPSPGEVPSARAVNFLPVAE